MDITDSTDIITNEDDGAGRTEKMGLKFTMLSTTKIISITKDSTSTATKGYVLDSSKNVLATGNFIGDICSFSSPQSVNKSTTYYIASDAAGAVYVGTYSEVMSFPISKTNLSFIKGLNSAADSNDRCYNLIAVKCGVDYTIGQKGLKTSWDELTASDATKAVGHKQTLEAEEKSLCEARYDVGL